MPLNYKRLQEKITFDDLMGTLSEEFAQLPDHRRANSSYDLADVLRGAFAMFSLKSPSLLALKELTKQEEKNLKAIYQIRSIPSDTQMRTTLDPLSPAPLRTLFAKLFHKLSEAGVIKELTIDDPRRPLPQLIQLRLDPGKIVVLSLCLRLKTTMIFFRQAVWVFQQSSHFLPNCQVQQVGSHLQVVTYSFATEAMGVCPSATVISVMTLLILTRF